MSTSYNEKRLIVGNTNIRMTIEEFINSLYQLESKNSEMTNTLLSKGVQGLSFTHQMALGSAFRKGISPEDFDLEEMTFNIYGRLALSGIQVEGGLRIHKEKAEKSRITSIFADYQFNELFLDWKAGFEASEHYSIYAV